MEWKYHLPKIILFLLQSIKGYFLGIISSTDVLMFEEVRICIHNTESVFCEYTIILIKIIVASKTNKAIIKLSEYSVNIWMNRLFLYTV